MEMRDRINNTRASLGDALARTPDAEREVGDITVRVRKALEQLREVDSIAERLDGVSARLGLRAQAALPRGDRLGPTGWPS